MTSARGKLSACQRDIWSGRYPAKMRFLEMTTGRVTFQHCRQTHGNIRKKPGRAMRALWGGPQCRTAPLDLHPRLRPIDQPETGRNTILLSGRRGWSSYSETRVHQANRTQLSARLTGSVAHEKRPECSRYIPMRRHEGVVCLMGCSPVRPLWSALAAHTWQATKPCAIVGGEPAKVREAASECRVRHARRVTAGQKLIMRCIQTGVS